MRQDDFGLRLAPAAWLRRGFWAEYFDDVPAAVADYRRELNVILQAAQWESDVDDRGWTAEGVEVGRHHAVGEERIAR